MGTEAEQAVAHPVDEGTIVEDGLRLVLLTLREAGACACGE